MGEISVMSRLLPSTLPETNSKFAPKNGWLEYDRFLLGWPIFRGKLLVSGRVCFILFLLVSMLHFQMARTLPEN